MWLIPLHHHPDIALAESGNEEGRIEGEVLSPKVCLPDFKKDFETGIPRGLISPLIPATRQHNHRILVVFKFDVLSHHLLHTEVIKVNAHCELIGQIVLIQPGNVRGHPGPAVCDSYGAVQWRRRRVLLEHR